MSEEHIGFDIDIKPPAREQFVARLVVSPRPPDEKADLPAKLERHVGLEKAVQLARQLLEACGASDHLIAQVSELAPEGEKSLPA